MALAVGFVAGGGAVGTLARDLALRLQGAAMPIPRGSVTYTSVSWTDQVPWVLLAINFIGVYVAVVVFVDDLVRDNQRSTFVSCSKSIHAETAKVRQIIFERLDQLTIRANK